MARFTGIGAGDKKKVAIAAALGVTVVSMAAYTLFGGPAPTPTPLPATVRPATVAVASTRTPAASRAPGLPSSNSLDPALHPEWMAETESYLYTGSGRNIFSQGSGPQPAARPVRIEPVRAPVRPSQQVAANPGPPPPPAIDLRFFGYAARKNGTRRAFLSHGDDVFVASEGDVVSHRYRIVHIAPFSVEVEDLPFHNTQSLPLVQN